MQADNRYEWIQKSVEELSLDESTYGEGALFSVNALTLGFNYDLFNLGPLRLAGGGQMTFLMLIIVLMHYMEKISCQEIFSSGFIQNL